MYKSPAHRVVICKLTTKLDPDRLNELKTLKNGISRINFIVESLRLILNFVECSNYGIKCIMDI